MSALNLKTAASLMVHLLLVPTTVEGFQHYHRVSICHLASSSSTAERGNTVLFNTQGDDNDDDDWSSSLPLSKSPTPFSQQLEQGKFNPLDYRGKSKTNRSSGSAQAQVNLRSMRMSSMTDDLLNSLGNKAAMRAVLEENRDFLLEPLESEETLAGSGSIYTPDMSRSERYQAYRKNVNKRLESSNNAKAKAVLTAMRDFVLEFENEGPLQNE
ncbi:unnamed protein product [Pseudo-nitzschia multistriata]|uniref:Uncharacterized protein n=1 Tax=Pseudo-nitzschia multistriata TaxID=183589 RepID=A0A448Z9X0_9STRA|nr:unnamed protein product [Pseudo-nitzschia multistriata]